MKLKTRLIMTFMTVIVLPVILSVTVITAFGRYQISAFERTYHISGTSYSSFINPVGLMSKVTNSTLRKLERVAKNDPDQLMDRAYLEQINEDLEKKNAFLMVRLDGEMYYEGKILDGDLQNHLPDYGDYEASSENGVYIGEEYQVVVRQVDFNAKGQQGSVFVTMNTNQIIPELKEFLIEMVIAIFLILIITSGVLIYGIYRCVVIPLGRMKIATQNIKDGNLDFELEVEADDEIGQLCRDFEEMRKRLKDTAEETVEYDRRSKELIRNISHDLKTPITAIKGYAEGIMDGVADTPEKMERYIKTIYNKTIEMDALISELTLYSKIDANRIPYNFSQISVAGFFADCADELEMELGAKGIGFSYHNYVNAEVMVIADAEQLKRVVNNIISNSVKYMDKTNKIINLRVSDVGDFVQVELEDNGKGIGAKELPYIFERFYRTDESRNSLTGGSGIGLSIVKKIVEDHGGKIWAASKEGTGTVMCFVLRKYQEVPANE